MDIQSQIERLEKRVDILNSNYREVEREVKKIEMEMSKIEEMNNNLNILNEKVNMVYNIITKLLIPVSIGIVSTMLAVILKLIL